MPAPDDTLPEACLAPYPGGTCLSVRLMPSARTNQVDGRFGGALKIRIQAPPVAGKANRQLLHFLGKKLGLSKQHLQLISGEKSRNKKILIKGLTPDAVRQQLFPKC